MENANAMNNEECQESLTVVLADDEPIIRYELQEMLEKLGFLVLASVEDGLAAIDACEQFHPDFAIMDIKMPVLDGLAAAHYVFEHGYAKTIVLITAYGDVHLLEKAGEIGVAGYLIKPVRESSLLACIKIARARSLEISNLKDQVFKTKTKLDARKEVDRAKGLLMQQRGLSESEAYHYLRLLSRDHRMSMQKVAQIIIEGNKE